ncbi:ribose-phosphate diphosphokinase [Candidatus Woesearchaeota archaeon]|nr:ribose-phosphate diphosphokinase [Candidatus Woesearchaeota archaeon]
MYASYVFLDRFKGFYGTDFGDFVFTSTDAGGGERAKHYHKKVIGSGLAFGNKVKSYTEDKKEVESVDIVGNVDGKNVMIIEDMIDTGGSILKAAEAAKNKGANNITVAAAHGIFSGDAEEKLTGAYNSRLIDKVWCSDSVFHCKDFLQRNKWLEEISVAGLFARVIQKIHHGEGVSEIYRG